MCSILIMTKLVPSQRMLMAMLRKMHTDSRLPQTLINLTSVKGLIKIGHCVFLCDESGIYGFGAVWKSKKRSNHYEIGPIWVDKGYKGQGGSGEIFHDLLNIVRKPRRTIFVLTQHEVLSSIVTSHGWAKVENWRRGFWNDICEAHDYSDVKSHREPTLFYITLE